MNINTSLSHWGRGNPFQDPKSSPQETWCSAQRQHITPFTYLEDSVFYYKFILNPALKTSTFLHIPSAHESKAKKKKKEEEESMDKQCNCISIRMTIYFLRKPQGREDTERCPC